MKFDLKEIENENISLKHIEIFNSNFGEGLYILDINDDNSTKPINIGLVTMSSGRQYTFLSKECTVNLNKNGVEFNKNNNTITLTKEELINEFKIGLEKGYYKIEELLD